MIPYKLAIFSLITLFSAHTHAFINTVTVFKRPNRTLKRHNYIITCGDVHEGLPHLNNDQIKAIRSTIYNSDSKQTLFLAEDIASMKTAHPLLDDVVEAINNTYDNPNTKTKIPLITLVNYALTHKKPAINLDERAHTLLQTIFYYLVMSYIQRTKYPFVSQRLSAYYKISLPEIGFILLDLLKNLENDYLFFTAKLKELESETKKDLSNGTSKPIEMSDLKHYIDCYNSFFYEIKKDKEYAQSLVSQNFDLIDYYVQEYTNYKNIRSLNLELLAEAFNFNIFMGSGFLGKMLTFGSYTIELKALKMIIDNLSSKSRIFIFAGQKHIENLNKFLEKMTFNKIYQKTETPDISKIYNHITEHIQQASSYNKINDKYIAKVKQNLNAIDPAFFKICQKKHLHAKDFKDLK